uniref:Endo/exonuclease/phosphatase domain-containing protein n=1 Tax=Steinernema glaseri TaxID=37863 RepID=A0A1I8A3Q5_9BILA
YSPLGSIVKPSYNANDLIFTKRQQHCSTGPPDGCYRILSYNVLADKYTKSEEPEHPFFPYCDSAALSVNTRYPLLLKELKGYLADLLFLQEVDQSIYVTYLKNYLEALGYDSIYAGKGVNGKALEGCVTAYKRAKFEYMKHDRALLSQFALNGNNGDIIQLLEQNEADRTLFLSRTNVNLVVVLRERSTKGILVTANTHIYFKPENANIKVLQAVPGEGSGGR